MKLLIKWNNFKFTNKEEMEIDKYLFSKRTGTMDMEYYFKNPDFDIENFFNINGVDSKKPIISLATNMLWDAQVFFPTNFFSNMLEWLYFTIDYFKKKGFAIDHKNTSCRSRQAKTI